MSILGRAQEVIPKAVEVAEAIDDEMRVWVGGLPNENQSNPSESKVR